jgi:general secretion pathway protein G
MACLLIMAVLFPSVDRCRMPVWRATLLQLRTSIGQFECEYGRIPTDAEGLRVLVEKPANWSERKEWMPFLESMPCDWWGNQWHYVEMPGHKWGFGVYSTGADGVTLSGGNDRDDINSWDPKAPWVEYYKRPRLSPWLPVGIIVVPGIVTVLLQHSRPFLKGLSRRRQSGSLRLDSR